MDSTNKIYTCKICKLFLEEGNFNYVLDKRDGTTFLLCHDCRNELDKTTAGELSKEEFKKSIKKRWREGTSKIIKEMLEKIKQGFSVELVRAGSSTELTCDQLVDWFSDLEKEKKVLQRSDFLVILDNLEKKGKLCPKCLEFRNNLKNN